MDDHQVYLYFSLLVYTVIDYRQPFTVKLNEKALRDGYSGGTIWSKSRFPLIVDLVKSGPLFWP